MIESTAGGRLGLSEVEKLSSITRRAVAGPNSVRPQGEYFVAVEPNSFGIPSIDTCPGSTNYCEKDCYAVDAERRTATGLKLQRNLEILLEAGSVDGMTEKLHEAVSEYSERADRLGVDDDSRNFRIHWSGDFFSVDYAEAWRNVIEETPDMNFYAYTRSFKPDVNVLPTLTGLDNLDLFLSVDVQNVDHAKTAIEGIDDARIAYLVDYFEESEALKDRLGRKQDRRTLACPENMRDESGKRKLPVISGKGGACARCTFCINKPDNWDVVFVKSGLMYRAQGELPLEGVAVVVTAPNKKSPTNLKPMQNPTSQEDRAIEQHLF